MKTQSKVQKISELLKEKFAGVSFPACTRCNHKPSEGWSVVGNGMITRAIKAAGLPVAPYWSGMAPTPSTQAPAVVVEYARSLWSAEAVEAAKRYNLRNEILSMKERNPEGQIFPGIFISSVGRRYVTMFSTWYKTRSYKLTFEEFAEEFLYNND